MIVGNYIVERCFACGKMVRTNKWIFGGLHICAPEEVRRQRFEEQQHRQHIAELDMMRRAAFAQQQATAPWPIPDQALMQQQLTQALLHQERLRACSPAAVEEVIAGWRVDA